MWFHPTKFSLLLKFRESCPQSRLFCYFLKKTNQKTLLQFILWSFTLVHSCLYSFEHLASVEPIIKAPQDSESVDTAGWNNQSCPDHLNHKLMILDSLLCRCSCLWLQCFICGGVIQHCPLLDKSVPPTLYGTAVDEEGTVWTPDNTRLHRNTFLIRKYAYIF